MRFALISLCLLAVCLFVISPVRSQEDKTKNAAAPTEKDISIWMHQKSALQQRLMQGLSEGDFDQIRKTAVLLNVLSYFEGRAHSENPEYKRQLGHFDWANRELVRMAKEENLEGATLAYNQLTVSCVYCHKTLRDKGQDR
jgi:hypothetical protein